MLSVRREYDDRRFDGDLELHPFDLGDALDRCFCGDIVETLEFRKLGQEQVQLPQRILQVVKTLNPNGVNDPDNITPEWRPFLEGNTEMLFDMKTAGKPDTRSFTTDAGTLERCQ